MSVIAPIHQCKWKIIRIIYVRNVDVKIRFSRIYMSVQLHMGKIPI